jgi:LEA14-like dessication related protein
MRLVAQVLVVFCLAVVSGCATLPGTLQPEASVRETSIQNLSFDSVTLGVLVAITNPNHFNIPTGKLDLNLLVDGKQIAQASSEQNTSLKAKESTQMMIPVKIPYSSLFNLVKSARDSNEFLYEIAGSMAVPMPLIGDISLPLNYSGKAPIPQVPKISISSFSLSEVSLTRLKADLVLQIENNNKFPLNLNALKMDLKADGKSLVTAAPAANSTLKAEQSNSLHIPLQISTKDAGFALFNSLVSSKKIEWQVEGIGNLEGEHGLSLKDFGFNAKELLSALR